MDVGLKRCLLEPFADPVDRRSTAEAVVGPLPIVEVLPFVEAVPELRVIEVDCRPELLERGSLNPFDHRLSGDDRSVPRSG